MTSEILSWVKYAREVEIHKAGNAQGLIDWYNNGADGQIDWGSEGDFAACVAIAGKHLDNPEGFCQLRHIDATGEPAGKAPGEVTKGDVVGHKFHGNQWIGGDLSKYPLIGRVGNGEFGTMDSDFYERNLDKAEKAQAETTCAHCAKIVDPNTAWLVRDLGGGDLLRADKFFDKQTPEGADGTWRLVGDTCGSKQCSAAYRVKYSEIPEDVRPPISEIEPAIGTWNHKGNVYKANGLVTKGDVKGHVFRGNQHSTGGLNAFDAKNLLFTATCASGHANTIKVPDTWIERNPDGSVTGQFAASSQSRMCSTCSRPIDNRWSLVAGQKVLPNPSSDTPSQYQQWGVGGQNYVQTTTTPSN